MTFDDFLVVMLIFIIPVLIVCAYDLGKRSFLRLVADKVAEKRRDWRLMAYGGGAPIEVKAMTKEKAITFCANNHGKVMYVDEQHGFIFFKAS